VQCGCDVGLRKVTDDMKTHKNPALRDASSSAKPAPSPKPAISAKPQAQKPAHPPKCALEGKKWIVVSDTLPSIITNLCLTVLHLWQTNSAAYD